MNSLLEGHTIVVNVNGLSSLEDQQRAVDFLAGGCFALGGDQAMLSDGIFAFTPDGAVVRENVMDSKEKQDALVTLAKTGLALKGAPGGTSSSS